MKRLNDDRMRLVLVAFVAAIVLVSGSAKADFTFGEPTNLGPTVNSLGVDSAPCISADNLSLCFHSDRDGGFGLRDLWVTTQQTSERMPEGYWSTPTNLGPAVNSSVKDAQPSFSTDSLTLFFHSDREGGYGDSDLWVIRRPTIFDSWATPMNLGPTVNSPYRDAAPSISADNLNLYFLSDRPGGFGSNDIYMSSRATMNEPWGEPVNLGPVVNSSASDDHPSVSSDGLLLFFGSERPGGHGSADIWVTMRKTRNDPWKEPVNLGSTVNSTTGESAANISADGSLLYFGSNRAGGYGDLDLYQTPIIPIVDLNGDGIVDALDMCIMVDHWGTDNSLCDIGPMPWGDGVVDVQDLIILAEHLFEQLPGRPTQA